MVMLRMGLTAALAIAGAGAAAAAPATEDLVGRWGVAAYWNESDAARTLTQARAACGQPYVITRGRNGGAVMFEAFEGRPREVVVRGGEIVALEQPDARTTKRILGWDGQVLSFRYADEEIGRRYGTMLFVRCRR